MNRIKNTVLVKKRMVVLSLSGLLLIAIQLYTGGELYGQETENNPKPKIELSFFENDSVKQVYAVLSEAGRDGAGVPIADIQVHFYVQRNFGLLPLEGDNTITDENGKAFVDFPDDLPAESTGNVTVIAKIEDEEAYGNAEIRKTVGWGIPPSAKQSSNARAMWASGINAPWPLLIAVNSMIAGFLGVIIYIIYQLFKINKIGKHETKNK